jgi:hypothetical protein
MKKLLLALLLGTILITPALGYERKYTIDTPFPDLNKRAIEPGSIANPYEVRPDHRGGYEISAPLFDPQKPFEPGSPLNPIWIKPKY